MSSIAKMIYTVIIGPIELLFEVIFYLSNSILGNPMFSIVVLSLVVNFLVLPLYIRADVIQEQERKEEERLNKWIKHIKKTFKGDERFMMLQMYYSLNNYKPTYVLKSSLPLLLQIPFFIAAYNFLSNLSLLKGFSYGPIKDFGAPDAMISLFGISVNVLPILMTVINIISGMIYTKGAGTKDKIQLYGMALIFLVFLYGSPAGLVFYWTLNNIFSLIKNIMYKLRDPGRVVSLLASYSGVFIIGYALSKEAFTMRQKVFLIAVAILLQIPLAVTHFGGRTIKQNKHRVTAGTDVYVLSLTVLTILTGILIPSAVIASSTPEFVNIVTLNNPLLYVLHSLFYAIGIFLVWLSVFYAMLDSRMRNVFSIASFVISLAFITDYMFFGTDLGVLSNLLKFDNPPSYSYSEYIVNIIILVVVVTIGCILCRFFPKIVTVILISLAMACAGMSVFNCINISTEYKGMIKLAEKADDTPTIRLSKTGQNVIVIMMDRMIGRFIPFIMEEDPSLYEAYDGFTYYANTVSFGPKTNAGSPGLYGGYEYIPERMNERNKELLVDKHNEALKIMPVLFDEAGMDVTVFDPTYAGYGVIPDLSIYDDYPNIKKYITMGNKNIMGETENREHIDHVLNRNFFCYSMFKVSPLIFQRTLYNGGNYNSTRIEEETDDEIDMAGQSTVWLSQSHGITEHFMEAYKVLDSLPDITRVEEGNQGCFLMMSNDVTHEPVLLKEPEYVPANDVDNREYDYEHLKKYDAQGNVLNLDDKNYAHEENLEKVKHYQINMCAVKKLGEFFKYLKENGVYDNTKIIIVSDHSTVTNIDDKYKVEGLDENGKTKVYDCEQFTCALMVKDYNSRGFKRNDDFMTNADVPTLAFKDIINEPVNPFTGENIDNSYKNDNTAIVIWDTHFHTSENNGYRFLPDTWFSVHDNVHDKSNWKYLGYY